VIPGWLVRPSARVLERAVALQQKLRHIEWLRPIPHHFLHVWLGATAAPAEPAEVETLLADGRAALGGAERFRVTYPRLNSFHTAVVAEAESDAFHAVARRLFPTRDLSTFLPHLTLAVPTEAGPPEPLRAAVLPLRHTHLGEHEVDELLFCFVPASRQTILEPWTVVGAAPLP
jgi:hypothetical protein